MNLNKLYYYGEGLKSAVPEHSDIPQDAYNILTVDFDELEINGSILPYIEWETEESFIANLPEAKENISNVNRIKSLKEAREKALNTNTVEMLGHTFEARMKDEAGLKAEIEKGNPTLWGDVNDYMVEFTLSDLEHLLEIGTASVEAIWHDYKLAVKDLQS